MINLKIQRDSYLELDKIFYGEVKPTPLNSPFLIHFNDDFAQELGLDRSKLKDDEIVKFVNGELLDEIYPFAMVYAGHQFGHFVPRLGDGRAINLGMINGYKLQIKGAGRTLYSRDGDGRAVLRSSIREYLVSEFMHSLGIPTTRALAIIGSKHRVYRENWENGAIVLRASPTWIRFGSFEYFAHSGKLKELESLADFTIKESFPHLIGQTDIYIKMYDEIVKKTAIMIAKWMSVGFNHGVMNTDNMSIASLTIDYGPYAFLDGYDANYICNHTDREGRYSFSNQPQIGYWNLSALLEALSFLIDRDKLIEVLQKYKEYFNATNIVLLRHKLGLEGKRDGDDKLMSFLFSVMQEERVDTYFFRVLSSYQGDRTLLKSLFSETYRIDEWLDLYDERLDYEKRSHQERCESMKRVNPKYVLKNYMLQEAIKLAESGDFSKLDELFKIAKDPFSEHKEFDIYSKETPLEFRSLKLSCSS